jgi:serine/threonine-protein kinase
VIAVPVRRAGGPAAVGGASGASGARASTVARAGSGAFSEKLLSQVEATLARHVGPLAAIMVRRAAAGCDTVPALLSRLADQVTNPGARAAFLQQTAQEGSAQRAMAPTLPLGTATRAR